MTPEEFAERRRKIITTPTGEKVVVYIEAPIDEKNITTTPVVDKKKQVEGPTFLFENPKKDEKVSEQPIGVIEEKKKEEKKTTKTEVHKPKVGIGADQIDIEEFIDQELSTVDFNNLPIEAQETLGKLKSRKIVDEYERQLKDIRFELRRVIYEYNVLVDDNDEVVLSKDAEIILDRLSEIIDKIEELKQKIKIDNLNQYDDNYVYTLIEGYLKEFHDKKIVEEIEDSPLYIMLEEKLEELEEKRGKFSKKVEDKKEKLVEREIDFEKLKENYYSIDQLNNQLLEFQYDQNRFLQEIQETVRNAVTETDKVREEFAGLNMQGRRLLAMMSFQMFLPGARNAKGLAAAAAAYLYFMNNVIRPNTRTIRYKVITVTDYHNEIVRLLGKTSDQIDKMMRDLKDKFHDYIGVVPECDELLRNLSKIKSEIEEKEYEMKRIKKEQELELEKNDAKVKTIGEYPVN